MLGFIGKTKQTAQKAKLAAVRGGIIGNDAVIDGPYGARRLMYADYVASGRSYGPIEDKIRAHILPLYANTHTESSATGRQSTAFREQARDIIANSIGANDEDAIVFCGSGCTGAINKFIHMLRLKLPKGISKFGVDTAVDPAKKPIVFIGPFEHHSNDVQWRETIADVVTIKETKAGLVDLSDLEVQLKAHQDRPLLLGSFSAASNVSGILVDCVPIARLLHKYGALAAFDYAAAAPYIPINMNAGNGGYFDAIFISTHKLLGGPGTPGLLVVKKKWAQNKTPVIPGGGTVSYVSSCEQAYLEDVEHREEGGTPDIVGAIRAGLSFQLRDDMGAQAIADKEIGFAKKAIKRWGKNKNIQILGSAKAKRLPIFSFLIRHEEKHLHYNFVVALLNDLFGVQARGGCSCAGPYGHRLLGIDLAVSREYEKLIGSGLEILKPGWVRVGFNYFYSDDDSELLLRAVEWVANHGYKLLPFYNFDSATGRWVHQSGRGDNILNLAALDDVQSFETTDTLDELFIKADCYAGEGAQDCHKSQCCDLDAAPEHLKWFSRAG